MGFLIDFMPVNGEFCPFWGILGFFGGQVLGGSWGMITNSDLYKPGLFEAMEDI
jgi:hypothetical protein